MGAHPIRSTTRFRGRHLRIADRLVAIPEPGGIVVAGPVYDQVEEVRDHFAHLAAAYAHAGRPDGVRELAAFLEARPDATVAFAASVDPYPHPVPLEHPLGGRRTAGLPE